MSDTSIAPDVSDSVSLAPKKFLKVDNTWDTEGLLALFNEQEDIMERCTMSGTPLFYVTKAGQKVMLNSFGYCRENGKPYAYKYLATPEGAKTSGYPIEYIGYMCKEEAAAPLTDEELMEIRKEFGI